MTASIPKPQIHRRFTFGVALLALTVVLSACSGDDKASTANTTDGPDAVLPTGGQTNTTKPATASTASTAPENVDGSTSYVATAKPDVASVEVFESAGGKPEVGEDGKAIAIANPNENGVEAVFLIKQRNVAAADGKIYHEVDLPIRPNGSTGWVRGDDVNVTYHSYRIRIQLAKHTLQLFEGGTQRFDFPIGVGTNDTPTPGGVFYIKELLQPPDPTGPYGTYAYGLSGYSQVLDSFNGGDGVVGIHGTNDESVIGTDVSHGCIRMKNADIEKLVQVLPLGVPVEILA